MFDIHILRSKQIMTIEAPYHFEKQLQNPSKTIAYVWPHYGEFQLQIAPNALESSNSGADSAYALNNVGLSQFIGFGGRTAISSRNPMYFASNVLSNTLYAEFVIIPCCWIVGLDDPPISKHTSPSGVVNRPRYPSKYHRLIYQVIIFMV